MLSVLGARVAHGRGFVDDDATAAPPRPQQPQQAAGPPPAPLAAPVAPPPPLMVELSDAYWHQRFSGDTSAVGSALDLDGQPAIVVGVLAPGFEMLFPPNTNIPSHPDLLVVQRINFETASRINVFMRLIGRM